MVLKRTGVVLKRTDVILKKTGVTSAHNKQPVSSLDAQGVSLESVHNQQQFLKSTTQSTSSPRIMLVTSCGPTGEEGWAGEG